MARQQTLNARQRHHQRLGSARSGAAQRGTDIPTRIPSEETVNDQRVEVDVQIERRPPALDDDNSATSAIGHTSEPGKLSQPLKDRTHVDDRATERMIPRQHVLHAQRQRRSYCLRGRWPRRRICHARTLP